MLVNRFNHTSGVTAVTPTDCPLSRSAIVVSSKFLLAFFMLSRCFLDFSVGVGAFVTGLSQIFSYLFLSKAEIQSPVWHEGHSVFLSLVVFCGLMYNWHLFHLCIVNYTFYLSKRLGQDQCPQYVALWWKNKVSLILFKIISTEHNIL